MKYRLNLELIDDDGAVMEEHWLSVESNHDSKDLGKLMGKMANASACDDDMPVLNELVCGFTDGIMEFEGWSALYAVAGVIGNAPANADQAVVVLPREKYPTGAVVPMNLRLVGRDVWDAVNAERNKR